MAQLTEQQSAFLDALFGEAQGDAVKAKKIAGYSNNSATSAITSALKDHIYERTKEYIAVNGPKAAFAVTGVIADPTAIGNKDKLAAAKDILDRGGYKPTEEVKVTANPLFILPDKKESD